MVGMFRVHLAQEPYCLVVCILGHLYENLRLPFALLAPEFILVLLQTVFLGFSDEHKFCSKTYPSPGTVLFLVLDSLHSGHPKTLLAIFSRELFSTLISFINLDVNVYEVLFAF